MRIRNLAGLKFGRLTVVLLHHKVKRWRNDKLIGSRVFWLCSCKCGNKVVVVSSGLHAGTKSCGCLQKEVSSKIAIRTNFKHGYFGTKIYNTWYSIKTRCLNKRSAGYKHYGKRGIKVEWRSFQDFKNDMYESMLQHQARYGQNTTIERINNNGNYCKENCRWATVQEQHLNKRQHNQYTNND